MYVTFKVKWMVKWKGGKLQVKHTFYVAFI